jgi:pimeloyl-ACP methyl ester carboxylesterase
MSALTRLCVFATILSHALADSKFFRQCFFTPPQCPNRNITFHLYTRDHQTRPMLLDVGKPKSIARAKFVDNRPLIVLLHGYTGDKDYAPNSQLRPAYFQRDDFNIISVDYSRLAQAPCYLTAVSNLPTVANCTAQLLDHLIDENFFTLDAIHVIGFSLGAQTAGMIANYMRKGRKLKRITGLDPAKPLFVRAENDRRIDYTDAEFVE